MPKTGRQGGGTAATPRIKAAGGEAREHVAPAPIALRSGRLAALLEWSKPYREIIGILITIVVTVSGAVAWVVARVEATYATQSEVHYLDCRTQTSIKNALEPIQMGEYATKIDARNNQIRLLILRGETSKETLASINELNDQITALTDQQRTEDKRLQAEIASLASNCISVAPMPGAKSQP